MSVLKSIFESESPLNVAVARSDALQSGIYGRGVQSSCQAAMEFALHHMGKYLFDNLLRSNLKSGGIHVLLKHYGMDFLERWTLSSAIYLRFTVVRISFKHRWGEGRGGGALSSYMEVGTDVRQEWPLFQAGKYIYGYTFSSSNIWIPQIFRPRCMNDKLSFIWVRKTFKTLCSLKISIYM